MRKKKHIKHKGTEVKFVDMQNEAALARKLKNELSNILDSIMHLTIGGSIKADSNKELKDINVAHQQLEARMADIYFHIRSEEHTSELQSQ